MRAAGQPGVGTCRERTVRQHCKERWTEKKSRERDTQADRSGEMERDPERETDSNKVGKGDGRQTRLVGAGVRPEMGQDGFREGSVEAADGWRGCEASAVVSDTQIPGSSSPHPPLQHRGALSWGWRWETGTEDSPLPQGSWLVGRQGRHGARASPRPPSQPGQRTQGPGSQLLLEVGRCFSFLPNFLPTVHPGGSGAGWGRRPPNHTQQQAKAWACAPLQPRSPDKGAKGKMGGAAGIKITDPFIKGKKSENPKEKRKIMIKTMCK